MSEKTKTKTQFATFEYKGLFGDPVLNNQRLAPLLQIMYEGLKQWNIKPENVKYRNVTGAMEPSVFYELANSRMVVGLSHAGITLTVQNADWSQAELITQLVAACWNALATATPDVKVKEHELQIAFTVLPEGKSLKEITKPFAAAWNLRPTDEVDFCGLILYTAHGLIVLDKNAVNPHALFIKIVHRFVGHIPMADMAKQLFGDEEWVSNVLGLEF